MAFGYVGSMRARPGHRAEVVAILLEAADQIASAGCSLYVVGVSETDPDLIVVSEIWQSREHHAASLRLPETRAAIERAMPMLTGEFTGQELSLVGGLGVPATLS
ncbi:putative quinol monooxygenase [Micromonospora thermarum]|uniref:Antibiotic biosynthesis monooxygenase n=1 Tax=Micromonospora thermarum TaxID=2720024 RepID=A0ABX0ZE64_9ACTN|nr:putative quinol monooxygenase [Micromonospora thermarum]NJP34200.1 antibiotic biosynthesis monooxygenase [Micromonospora thermarum]